MEFRDQLKLRKILDRICTGDLPNKPDGTKIDDMTERYIAYHNWNVAEGFKLIEAFIENINK